MHKFTARTFAANDYAAVVSQIRKRKPWRYGALSARPVSARSTNDMTVLRHGFTSPQITAMYLAGEVTYVVFSYATPVAALTKDYGLVVMKDAPQSPTSAKHLACITRVLLAADKAGAL